MTSPLLSESAGADRAGTPALPARSAFLVWPMRFAMWNCRACGQEIPFGKERFIDEPDVFAAIHNDCPVLGVFAEAAR